MKQHEDIFKLCDFGSARELKGETQLHIYGTMPETQLHVYGTMPYLSPEGRDRTKGFNHKTDIFSLGLIIYELCGVKNTY
jgi:serine/threonine protein kinase